MIARYGKQAVQSLRHNAAWSAITECIATIPIGSRHDRDADENIAAGARVFNIWNVNEDAGIS
jgi:hypothetical protein